MKRHLEIALSARKTRKLGVSPHSTRKELVISPQDEKEWEQAQKEEFLRTAIGHAENYATAFIYADNSFWECVDSLRRTKSVTRNSEETLKQGRFTLGKVPWLSNKAMHLFTETFVLQFVAAVRDRAFPKKRKSQARFLGDSLGMDGTTSARRSRDIVGRERAKQKRQANRPAAEFYIHCCGKARWTVKGGCPKCGLSPFPLPLPF